MTDLAWKDVMDAAFRYCAVTYPEFSTDEVWLSVKKFYPSIDTAEHRAMAGAVRRAVSAGIIKFKNCPSCGTTKVMTKSIRPEAHGQDSAIYVSRIWVPGAPQIIIRRLGDNVPPHVSR